MTTNPLGGRNSDGSVARTRDAGRVEPGLLGGLAERRGDVVGVLRVDRPAREGDLSGVAAHVVGPLDEQHVGAVPAPAVVAEQDEHGRLATALVRRQERAEVLRPDVLRADRETAQPAGQVVEPAVLGGVAHSRTPRYFCTSPSSSAADLIAPGCRPASVPSAA